MTGAYLYEPFTKRIPTRDINTILELGSRDALDAIRLSEHFDAVVYAFECHPGHVEACLRHLKTTMRPVHLIQFAVWNEQATIPFYPVMTENTGASSCFKSQGSYPYESLPQTQIQVPAIRLDAWLHANAIGAVDLICADLQGAEIKALEGMGTELQSVRYTPMLGVP